MTLHDRGGARLAKLLADPERAARVADIRKQMRQADAEGDEHCVKTPDHPEDDARKKLIDNTGTRNRLAFSPTE